LVSQKVHVVRDGIVESQNVAYTNKTQETYFVDLHAQILMVFILNFLNLQFNCYVCRCWYSLKL